ncbi:MAG: 4Fe-4S binding protein [Deltaproteobacteria bacterium]|nr:4Fe-4S binding protein [Deltaproteobacteria bacterium]
MAKSSRTIGFYPERCNGCNECVEACARAKSGTPNPIHSRIGIAKDEHDSFYGLALCRQCGEPRCVMDCPAGALKKDEDSGIVHLDESKCVNCLLCTLACPYAGITYREQADRVIKCDLCGGDPECVKVCKPGALELKRAADIYNRWGEAEDLLVPGLSACLGCNSELIIRHPLRRIGPNTVLATPPGCIPGSGVVGVNGLTGVKVPSIIPLLTNTAAMLAGAKRYYNRMGRDVTMLALAGDGGSADVGFQSLSGAAERGEQMVFICVDNEGYMNTGVQRSSTTPYGAWTSTTPVGRELKGKSRDAKPLPLIMVMHNCEYVATAAMGFMEDFYAKLDKAIEASKRGMAFLHIFSPCPTGWRFPPSQLLEVTRKAVETNMAPLWEYEKEMGRIRFTVPAEDPLPVREYLKLIGKYRHLDEEQIQYIQRKTEERIELLKKFTGDE